MEQQAGTATRQTILSDPALLRLLLSDVRFAPLWLVLRVTVGWLLLEASWRQADCAPTLVSAPAIALTLAAIALILGALTGPAAFVGGCLSVGAWAADSQGAIAFRLAAIIWLVLAWKTAGWIGLDRWLLPLTGLAWRGGTLFARPHDHAPRDSKAN